MIMSEWRHNNGFLIKHTMRVAKEDFDTNPSDDYKKEIFDYLCEAANNHEQANEKIQSLQSTIDGLNTKLFDMEKGKYGLNTYVNRDMNNQIKLAKQKATIDGMQTALTAKDTLMRKIKESMELSEQPFYNGMKLLNEALQNQNTREESKHDWPDDFKYENGNYENTCGYCGSRFIGHKRRVNCRVCDSTQAQQK